MKVPCAALETSLRPSASAAQMRFLAILLPLFFGTPVTRRAIAGDFFGQVAIVVSQLRLVVRQCVIRRRLTRRDRRCESPLRIPVSARFCYACFALSMERLS